MFIWKRKNSGVTNISSIQVNSNWSRITEMPSDILDMTTKAFQIHLKS